ncbi:MAG: bifunctional 5,10-methylenetetrahydrofolate dehydrogenase/5,10-methenyltetrahydrofolate cyclohydrolase [Candidatus Thermoplasmatota archaeon]
MTAEIIDGKKISKKIKEGVKTKVKKTVSEANVHPNVATIKIGDNSQSNLYLKLRDKAAKKAGIKSTHETLPENVSEKKVLKTIEKLNKNPEVHGIFVQYPIPDHISSQKIKETIDPIKDAEGLTPYNTGRLFIGDENIVPCTPLAVIKILEYLDVDLQGKDTVVINHSNVVGKPLTGLLLNRNTSVSVCHVFTKNLSEYTKKADIVVSATGKPGLITKEFIKKDSIVIDVGIIKTEKGITGDVNFEQVKDKAGKITPVPGGVGPVTVACSLLNMYKTYLNCIKKTKFNYLK